MNTLLQLSNKMFENAMSADAEVNVILSEVIKDFPELERSVESLVDGYRGIGRMAALRLIAAIGIRMVELET